MPLNYLDQNVSSTLHSSSNINHIEMYTDKQIKDNLDKHQTAMMNDPTINSFAGTSPHFKSVALKVSSSSNASSNKEVEVVIIPNRKSEPKLIIQRPPVHHTPPQESWLSSVCCCCKKKRKKSYLGSIMFDEVEMFHMD